MKPFNRSRRQFLARAGASVTLLSLPSFASANARAEPRLVVVLLRGALDGLAVAPPYGDGNYAKLRGALAFESPDSELGVLKLDGLFGLNPKLEQIHALYARKELAVVHAVATPYRKRSHFDAQNVLENGTAAPGGATDGWLNRAISQMSRLSSGRGQELGVSLGQNVPLLMRGPERVASWAPSGIADVDDDTMARITDMYARDALLSVRLEQALTAEAMAADSMDMVDAKKRGKKGKSRNLGIKQELVRAAAKFLRSARGPRVAVFDVGGWDTHANQGTIGGRLSFQLAALDRGVETLKSGLGDDVWQRTVMVMITEFGRTVAINGTRGTDHGTGTCALLMGGAVDGGKVVCDWPGMAKTDLLNARDLRPTTDLRALLKGVLHTHMGAAESVLHDVVFPNSADVPILEGIVRT